jgi:hypothetical protein
VHRLPRGTRHWGSRLNRGRLGMGAEQPARVIPSVVLVCRDGHLGSNGPSNRQRGSLM